MTALEEAARPFRLDWGWMLLRGLLALALGVFALANPKLTIASLMGAWGAYVFVDGVLALVFARRATHLDLPGWPSVLIGILGIGAGVLTFLAPFATTITLVVISALWGISVGASEIATSVRLHRQIANEWYLGVAGVVTVLFGLFQVSRPAAGTAAIAYGVSAFALLIGFALVTCAIHLRRYEERFES